MSLYSVGNKIISSSLNPLNVGSLPIWLDASDIGTINSGGTIADATAITSWKNKGTGVFSLFVTGSPTYRTNTLNGLPGIRTNPGAGATTGNKFSGTLTGHITNEFTFITVMRLTVGYNSSGYAFRLQTGGSMGAATANSFTATIFATDAMPHGVTDGATVSVMNTSIAASSNSFISAFTCYGSTNDWFNWKHSKGNNASIAANFTGVPSLMFLGGSLTASAGSLDIFEVLVYNEALSPEKYRMVFDYLKRKWAVPA